MAKKKSKPNKRLDIIRLIMSHKEIESQQQLMDALKAYGLEVSQATISSDLRRLHAVRRRTETGWLFQLPDAHTYHRVPSPVVVAEYKYAKVFKDWSFSHPVGLIKVLEGHAQYIAKELDDLKIPEILGTVAGTDTIMLLCHSEASEEDVREALSSLFPGLSNEEY